MMVKKIWDYESLGSEEEIGALQGVLKTPWWVTQLLWQRGIRCLSDAQAFFNPSLGALHDPLMMKDMGKAVRRIWDAIDGGERIGLYGDYDVDGTTSVALLYKALRAFGAMEVSYYIPSREREGYGVSGEGIKWAMDQGIDLLICVDCGTRAVEMLGRAKEYGIETIVCDHHETGDVLPPTVAMLNPKRQDCRYPFKGLSACGIVFKVVQAMAEDRMVGVGLDAYLDLVALSIAADIVPMVGENRILMYHGLRQFNIAPRAGIWALKNIRQQDNAFSVGDVVFGIAPLINAAGRVSHAQDAVKLLLTEEREEAKVYAALLSSHNALRKAMDEEATGEAFSRVEHGSLGDGIVLVGDEWSKGIVGIVAARCAERYQRPTIILTREGDRLVGSGRSVVGYNLYNAVRSCDAFLTKYGGHHQAVGLRLPVKNLGAFTEAFVGWVKETLRAGDKEPKQQIDLVISLKDLSIGVCRLLGRMGPFGPGHRQPVFATFPVGVEDYRIYKGKHVKIFFREKEGGVLWEAIGFHMAEQFVAVYEKGVDMAVAYKVSLDRYQGMERIQLVLKDIKVFSLAMENSGV